MQQPTQHLCACSCFSAEALAGPGAGFGGGDVLDACAAPGNKTTHLAALLNLPFAAVGPAAGLAAGPAAGARVPSRAVLGAGRGTVHAMDRDPVRLATLVRRAHQAGCCASPDLGPSSASSSSGGGTVSSAVGGKTEVEAAVPSKKQRALAAAAAAAPDLVVAHCGDFLALDVAAPHLRGLRAVLLDPSCSGSGITASLDRLVDRAAAACAKGTAKGGAKGDVGDGGVGGEGERFDAAKVAGLARFQAAALRKAMSFPQVVRVVYSTCSVHDAENELVVAAVLADPVGTPDDDAGGGGGEDVEARDEEKKERRAVASAAASAGEAPGAFPPAVPSAAARPGPFALRPALSGWARRGRAVGGLSAFEAACLVRADPSEDDTHGFFVACFDRVDPATGELPPLAPGSSVSVAAAAAAAAAKRKRDPETAAAAATVAAQAPSEGASSSSKRAKNEKRRLKRQRHREAGRQAQVCGAQRGSGGEGS